VEVWQLDLASFKSVRAFAERFVKSKMPLHLLINNGTMAHHNI
jgi:NAD(P)-dependent dehydrogenase (short-subunit alcohol dehydrogenase family)